MHAKHVEFENIRRTGHAMFGGSGLSFDDVEAAINLGIAQALGRYRLDAGAKFSSYAIELIRYRVRDEVRRPHRRVGGAPVLLSLDAPLSADSASTYAASLEAPYVDLLSRMMASEYLEMLRVHNPRYAQVLRLYYMSGLTFREVGKCIGMSSTRVAQIRDSAVGWLQRKVGA